MADRRMFSRLVTESDSFNDMPLSAQALYFRLGMETDDYGFVSSPKKVCRAIGANDDDFKLLAAKGFILLFDTGVIVVTHHNVNNSFAERHRRKPYFQEELMLLEVDDRGQYRFSKTPGQLPNSEKLHANCTELHEKSTDSVMFSYVSSRVNVSSENSTATRYQVDTGIPYSEIIDYLNDKTGKHFRPTSKATRSLIKARFSEGYTLDDFKRVIDNKCAAWKGDERFDQYLKPETLFRPSHFEGYLNERRIERRGEAISAELASYGI